MRIILKWTWKMCGYECIGWIRLTLDRVQLQAFVNMMAKFAFHKWHNCSSCIMITFSRTASLSEWISYLIKHHTTTDVTISGPSIWAVLRTHQHFSTKWYTMKIIYIISKRILQWTMHIMKQQHNFWVLNVPIYICLEYRGTEALRYFNESLLHCKITCILTGHTQGMWHLRTMFTVFKEPSISIMWFTAQYIRDTFTWVLMIFEYSIKKYALF